MALVPATITIQAPELEGSPRFYLPENGVLLVGRHPDPKRLPEPMLSLLEGLPLSLGTLDSKRVSSNHAVLISRGDEVLIYDVGSRNGTFLQVHPQQRVKIAGELKINLSLAPPRERVAEGPRNAEWTSSKDYAEAICRAIREWLISIGTTASVIAVPQSEATGNGWPLADGSELRVVPQLRETHLLSWSALFDKVRGYIHEQNSRYDLLDGHEEGYILASRTVREVHRQVADAAARGMRVMLLGPTGVGKERLASCYHRHSRQHRGPYATINCALLNQNLIYAQLFGAKKGSFTGSTGDLVGLVEAAHDGTLFLDEVADMPSEVQKALLRFLDTSGEYQRLGDPHVRRVSVQIVCATNVALDDIEERASRMREDLWYRLAVKVVRVPPLRERPEDIGAFLHSRTLFGTGLRVAEALSAPARELVLRDPLPGNFRDLENFIERLPAVTQPDSIDEATCAAALSEGRGESSKRSLQAEAAEPRAGSSSSFQDISALASAAFVKDHGEKPQSWTQMQLFTEKYLKPVFVAYACGLENADEIGRGLNLSGLARRLNIADGTTVKLHLLRYFERFRKRSPEEP